ncbi:beta-1,3-glucanase family protein [Roseivirga sp.]|uniref:beta-1,3-glucanase family protein n=1 Tax=Roseivirga sp. TaxID=1964215 RepID=UPI003B51E296
MSSTTITINNKRTAATTGNSEQLNVLLTADSHSNVTGLTVGQRTALGQSLTFSFEYIKSGRLYVGYGDFDNPPTPNGSTYFGWIEFTRTSSDSVVWINLSNVDIVGLPLTIAGTDSSGNSFSCGYETPMIEPKGTKGTGILKQLEAVLTDNANGNSAALIKCGSGQTKVLGPNHMPGSYRPYDNYITSLIGQKDSKGHAVNVPLTILSDTPKNGSPVRFTGSFHAKDADGFIISLASEDGNHLLKIKEADLTTQIIYQCDGGHLYYSNSGASGLKKYPQNRTSVNDPNSHAADQTISNSTFREIMIGLNEGYFSGGVNAVNDNTQFPGMIPFASGYGSQYAQVIHENSNSYGFPYADSNLKVLITAEVGSTITVDAIDDTVAAGYQAPSDNTSNEPQSGTYSLGIGSGSAGLGVIKINNWRYIATDGAYGGFLPDLPDWTKMEFTGAGKDKYIWIKNGQIVESTNGTNCLTGTATLNSDKVFVWGADLAWNGDTDSPAKPD